MAQETEPAGVPIERSASGTADEQTLNEKIAAAWRSAISDPKERAGIAAGLGVDESELDPENPPFKAEVTRSGLTGGEVLIAFAAGVALALAKDLGSSAGKAAAEYLKDLWKTRMRRRVSPPGSRILGSPKDDELSAG